MARIKRKDVAPHVIMPDTSVLWHGDKTHVINPDFAMFWQNHQEDFTLEFVLPAVVREELLFQQVISAVKSMNQVSELMNKISRITETSHRHRMIEGTIREQIKARFDKWLLSCGGQIAVTPFNDIDWPEIQRRAVWRLPPFELDEKRDDFEKGFRDALILETVINTCEQDTRPSVNFVFLCADELLRSPANERLAKDARFMCYESLDDFASYLRLTKEELTNQFIRSLIRKASAKFFSKGDKSCLALQINLPSLLHKDHSKYFDDPTESDSTPSLGGLLGLSAKSQPWAPVEKGMFWVGNSQFHELRDGNTYHWMTIVTYARLFRREPVGLGLVPESTERILVLPFSVRWSAHITKDARFRNVTIEGIELTNNAFREPTKDDYDAYGISATKRKELTSE
jgi:hypothetical protein